MVGRLGYWFGCSVSFFLLYIYIFSFFSFCECVCVCFFLWFSLYNFVLQFVLRFCLSHFSFCILFSTCHHWWICTLVWLLSSAFLLFCYFLIFWFLIIFLFFILITLFYFFFHSFFFSPFSSKPCGWQGLRAPARCQPCASEVGEASSGHRSTGDLLAPCNIKWQKLSQITPSQC